MQGDCPAEGLLERGRVWSQMDHPTEALDDFAAARRCDPTLADVDREEAGVWLALGRPEVARMLLETHLEKHPDDGGAHALLAECHAAAGRWPEADAEWSRAMRGHARWTPDLALEWIEARALAAGPEPALTLALQALARMPGAPAVEDRVIQLEVELGRTDQALARIDARIEAWPTQLDAWVTRGDVLAAAGRTDEARASWSEVEARYATLPARLQNERTRAIVTRAQERLER